MANPHFYDLFNQYVEPKLHPTKVTITFPEQLIFAKPLACVLLKLITDNPHFHVLTPDDFDGFDVPSEFGARIGHKRARGMMAYMFVQDKCIFIDYRDASFYHRSEIKKVVNAGGENAVDGCIKFHFSKDNYEDCPFPVYPFIYPGPNDFRDIVKHYPKYWDEKYPKQFLECAKSNSFRCSVFARWDANFGSRKVYTKLSPQIPNADVLDSKKSPTINIHEYMDLLSRSKFGISARGSAKFSHREMEVLSVGVPLLFEDTGGLFWNPLNAGEHFINITCDSYLDIVNYYLEHYDEALKIGRQGYEYYEKYHTHRGMQNVFKEIVDVILGKKSWKQL